VTDQSIAIQGVPSSVTREQVVEALRILGLDPFEVVEFSGDSSATALHVTVYALDQDGQRFTVDDKKMATHKVTVPIVEKGVTT
jgi:hypothetical protein